MPSNMFGKFIKNSNKITELQETNAYIDKYNSKLSFLKGIF